MNHGVAVRAYGSEICDGVDLVPFLDRSQGREVVDVNEALPHFAVSDPKIESTYGAAGAVMCNALLASRRIPFIGIDRDSSYRTFRVQRRLGDLFGM